MNIRCVSISKLGNIELKVLMSKSFIVWLKIKMYMLTLMNIPWIEITSIGNIEMKVLM